MSNVSQLPIVGIGAGAHSAMLIDVLRIHGTYNIVGLVDADSNLRGSYREKCPVLGGDEELKGLFSSGVRHFFMGVGGAKSCTHRKEIFENVLSYGFLPVSVIHPSAIIANSALIEPGVAILPAAVINMNAKIKQNVIVNSHAVVEHDVLIGAHSHIASGACVAGGVCIGSSVLIGANATIREQVQIEDEVVVGAGSVVLSSLKKGVYVGNPATLMRKQGEFYEA